MSNKTMITGDIFLNDEFLEMSNATRLTYIYCLLNADSEGFFEGKRVVIFQSGAKLKDFKELVDKKYLIEKGEVYAVKHWYILNKIRTSQIGRSKKESLRKFIFIRNDGAYTLNNENDCIWYPLFFEVARRLVLKRSQSVLGAVFEFIYGHPELTDLNDKVSKYNGKVDTNLLLATADFEKIFKIS